jgi:cytochrome P450
MKFFTPEKHTDITGYEAVRAAARDAATYSSDLQGDRDVRDYRQIPLEYDPPTHTDYRHAIQPLFLRPRLESHIEGFRAIAAELFDSALSKDRELDVYNDLALPFVVSSLGVIYQRPQDVAEWVSWGHDVWTAKSSERSGDTLHEYLQRVFTEPNDSDDIWGTLRSIRPAGELISEAEFKGYASVLLAGGRDTVIKLVTGLTWHLLRNKAELNAVQSDSDLERVLINEMLRFLSPLPAIERVNKAEFDESNPSYQRLHFASANHDPSVWDRPDEVLLTRGRTPHLAFGYGPHACIGMNMAEYEAKAWLHAFLPIANRFELVDAELVFAEVDGIRYLSDLRGVKIKTCS